MPALRRSGTGVLETKGEEKIYIDKKNGGRMSRCFCLCAEHGTNLASESLATGIYRQV